MLATLVVLFSMQAISGGPNPIDAPLWPLSVPLLMALMGFVGYRFPGGAWVWGFAPWLAHALLIVVGKSNLMPIALIASVVYCVPHYTASVVSGEIRKFRDKRKVHESATE